MTEIIFDVQEAEEGGFWARALGQDVFTQADNWDELRAMARDAVACHFGGAGEKPKMIRLHFVRDEVIPA